MRYCEIIIEKQIAKDGERDYVKDRKGGDSDLLRLSCGLREKGGCRILFLHGRSAERKFLLGVASAASGLPAHHSSRGLA